MNSGNVLLTVMSSLYLDSNIAMAAKEPDPIVAKGNVSVDPCGYTCIRVDPVQELISYKYISKNMNGKVKNESLQYANGDH